MTYRAPLEHRYEEAREAVKKAIAKFPETFGLRSFPGKLIRIGKDATYVSENEVMIYTQIWNVEKQIWQDFVKGTQEELRQYITKAPEEVEVKK